MLLLNTFTYEIKKSKFIAYYYQIDKQEEIKEILNILRSEHKKARHIPYAYILDNTAGKSDDKEPTNTAGLPIYNLMVQKNLNNKAIFIVRYFGGTKLGTGNLLRAYLTASKEVINEKKPQ